MTKNHLILSLLLTLVTSLSAYPWGDIGHGSVGYIAEKNLSPKAQKMIHKILGVEPLAVAAIFPDQVRSDDRFKAFAPFHFVEVPFGERYENLPANRRAKQSANEIISQVPALLLSRTTTRNQKMILLRYLVHVVGDVHQPLHVGNGVDMGANLCNVRWTDPESGQLREKNLHTVWDESLIANIADEYVKATGTATTGKRYFGYKEMGDLVIKKLGAGLSYDQAQTPKITDWYQESASLHPLVYPDTEEVKNPADRAYCKIVNGKFDPAKIPTLDAAYVARSLPIVERQILLGGYRLAGLLNKTAEEGHFQPLDPAVQADLLKEILLTNHDE